MRVVGVAGRCTLDEQVWKQAGFAAVHTTTEEADNPEQSMTDPGPLLERIGRRIGESLTAGAS